jgi:diacylglycerol kinase (ATP)
MRGSNVHYSISIGLKIFQGIKNLKIVVGGGDGTVCSVLNYLTGGVVEEWKTNNPPVAVFPLGTGNDLSRALGWGSGGEDCDPKLYLEELEKKGRQTSIDRWIMTISNPQSDDGEKVYTIYNYLGVGLDARVCYDFHKVREKYPSLFISPLSNKLIYTNMGALDLFVKKGEVLIKDYIVVEVDGKVISLEGLENIVLLNITHWAGGVSGLWKESAEFKPSSMNDGIIEILGVSDMLHLGQIQVGMDLPLQISQGKEVTIKSIADCDMSFQIDGEPFQLKSPFLVKVAFKDKVNLLATSSPNPNEKMRRIIDEAFEKAVIDRDQHQYLLGKLNS